MKKTALILGSVAACLLLYGWLASEMQIHAAVPADRGALAQDSSRSMTSPADLGTEPTRAVATPDAQQQSTATSRGPGSGLIVLHGRCVDSTGAPLAGILIAVKTISPGRWTRQTPMPGPQRTGADGRFQLRVPPVDDRELVMTLRSAHHARQSRVLCLVEESRDFGDIIMHRGSMVQGRVLDLEGHPQPDYTIRIGQNPEPQQDQFATPRMQACRTDAQGNYRVGPLLPGIHRIRLPGAVLVGPEQIEVASGGAPVEQLIEIHSPKTWSAITGVLVDDLGRPIQGAKIVTQPPIQTAIRNTNAAGEFRIMKPASENPAAVPTAIRIGAYCPGFADLIPKATAKWGAEPLRIPMRRVRTLEIQVLSGEQRPYEDFDLWLCRPSGEAPSIGNTQLFPRFQPPHPEGRLSINNLRDGTYWVKVLPRNTAWAESDFLHVDINPTTPTQLRVPLQPAVRRAVKVRRLDGTPLSQVHVELIERLQNQPTRAETRVMRRGSTIRFSAPYLRCQRWTNAAGSAQVFGQPNTRYDLRLKSHQFSCVVAHDIEMGSGLPPLEFEIARGASISGRIGPAEFLATIRARRPFDTLKRESVVFHQTKPDGSVIARPTRAEKPIAVESDGSFKVEGLAAGDWEISLRFMRPHGISMAEERIVLQTETALGADEQRQITIDASAQTPHRVTLRPFLNEQPYSGHRMQLQGPRDRHEIRRTGDGLFHADLPAGRYLVFLIRDRLPVATDSYVQIPAPAPVTVQASTRKVSWECRSEGGEVLTNVALWFDDGLQRTRYLGKTAQVERTFGRLRIWSSIRGLNVARDEQVKLADVVVGPGSGPLHLKIVVPDRLGY